LVSYNHSVDVVIADYLYKRKSKTAYFNELVRATKRIHPKATPRLVSRHLDKLHAAGQLKRTAAEIGKRRYYQLTPAAQLEWELDIFSHVRSKREKLTEESEAEKDARAYQLLFYTASAGGRRIRKSQKAQPGNIVAYDPNRRQYVAYSFESVPGVGVSDFFVEPRHLFTQAGALSHITFSSPKEVEKYFVRLRNRQEPLIKQVDEFDGEARYDLADPKLERFIMDCWFLFTMVLFRLKDTWRHIRKPSKEEAKWYLFMFGRENLSRFFLEAELIRNGQHRDYQRLIESVLPNDEKLSSTQKQLVRRKLIIDHKRQIRQGIRELDRAIEKRFKALQKDYGNTVEEKYPYPAKKLKEMVYPTFLANLQKKCKI
jgi:DNA-binding HxlR family transcriptional regulator